MRTDYSQEPLTYIKAIVVPTRKRVQAIKKKKLIANTMLL